MLLGTKTVYYYVTTKKMYLLNVLFFGFW